MKVREAPFESVIQLGMYQRGNEVVCNLCGGTAPIRDGEELGDMLIHLVDDHFDDELPEVDPAGEEVGCVGDT